MLRFVTQRIIIGFFTIITISVISFAIIELPPGDYINTYINARLMEGTATSAAEAAAMRHHYGLDRPVYVRYFKWMGRVLRGDFGNSLAMQRPIADLIGERLAMTMLVTLAALLLTWAVALPIGIYSAVRRYSVADYVFTVIGFIGIAVPNFLLALSVMYFGWVYLGADVGGLFSDEYLLAPWSPAKVWDLIKHLPTPAIVLGLAGTASLIRVMRANLLDELHKPYVITARARGLPERRLILKYPVRVALNPFASTIGYLFPLLVSGSVIVSLVLGLPTVGPLLLASLRNQDMFLAGTIVLMLGTLTVLGTLVSDLVLVWLDPRIRFGER